MFNFDFYTCMQTNSTCYKGTVTTTPIGILWHSTGVNNPNLKRYVQPTNGSANYAKDIAKLGKNTAGNDWNHIYRGAGLNAWIGKFADGSVGTVQTMPWNYMPWGCGKGSKGSLNRVRINGKSYSWIQFEICEDGLKDKNYAQKVYDEALRLTAYLCDKFNINPTGTVNVNGTKVPTITCHQDSWKLGYGSGHADINHWFPKILGKNMSNVRTEVAALLKGGSSSSATHTPVTPTPTPAPATPSTSTTYKNGDIIKLKSGATYASGKKIPDWVIKSTLYYRGKSGNNVIFSTQKTGAITGTITPSMIVTSSSSTSKPASSSTTPAAASSYKVRVNTKSLRIRKGAGTNYAITGYVRMNEIFTIVETKGNWGKLKSGQGWICLDYTKKVN